jgi:hypothetical protein
LGQELELVRGRGQAQELVPGLGLVLVPALELARELVRVQELVRAQELVQEQGLVPELVPERVPELAPGLGLVRELAAQEPEPAQGRAERELAPGLELAAQEPELVRAQVRASVLTTSPRGKRRSTYRQSPL